MRHESSSLMSMNCEFLKTIAFHCCIAALILNSMPSVGCYFFCLKCISLCGQLPSRPKQKHYLYYHLTCGLHNILMYSFSKCQDFFILHASFLIPRTDFFSLRYRSFEKHLQNRAYLTNLLQCNLCKLKFQQFLVVATFQNFFPLI